MLRRLHGTLFELFRDDALKATFIPLGEKLGIPVAIGLPVGHGPNYAPLPLGAEYILTPQGTLRVIQAARSMGAAGAGLPDVG